MGYQVLARKWRPSTFQEMVGQQHVLRALVNGLDNDRLHHAYLFTGTRGVGKTTVARILAKCLNCDQAVQSVPCGECASCVEIAEGRSVDLIEVDAASRTKVEDTRDLLDNVQYAPTRSRFKIYLIDEVHMLSTHSFNALLKTLEEPPPHAKFLLATTDPQKLPATILSRCLQFNLKNMIPEQIVEHLANVLAEEGVSHEEGALQLLARGAAGSMRDALSLTDQAIAFGSGSLKEEEVRDMLGTVDRGRVLDLVECVIANDAEGMRSAVDRIAEHAPDYSAALEELIAIFHQLTVLQVVPESADGTWSDTARMQQFAQDLSLDDTQLCYQFAVNGRRDLPVAPDPRIALEMTLFRMLAFRPAGPSVKGAMDSGAGPNEVAEGAPPTKKPKPPVDPVAAPQDSSLPGEEPLVKPASGHDEPAEPSNRAADTAAQSTPEPLAESARNHQAVANDEGDEDLPTRANWPEFFETLGLVGITQNIAMHCELVAVAGRQLSFVLDVSNASLFRERQIAALELAFQQVLELPVTIDIKVGKVGTQTPFALRAQRAEDRQLAAERALDEDQTFAYLLGEYDATVIEGSIRPPTSYGETS
ncbi:MAG: DNA polymerase III subunit gamma/tau [Halieaceae bacterium]